MTRYSDREDAIEDPVRYQDAVQVYPRSPGRLPDAEYQSPTYEQLIAFENEWPRHGGAKDGAIRATFHLTGIRYYQLINRMINDPTALELDPALIYRLRAQRDERLTTRQSRTYGRETT